VPACLACCRHASDHRFRPCVVRFASISPPAAPMNSDGPAAEWRLLRCDGRCCLWSLLSVVLVAAVSARAFVASMYFLGRGTPSACLSGWLPLGAFLLVGLCLINLAISASHAGAPSACAAGWCRSLVWPCSWFVRDQSPRAACSAGSYNPLRSGEHSPTIIRLGFLGSGGLSRYLPFHWENRSSMGLASCK